MGSRITLPNMIANVLVGNEIETFLTLKFKSDITKSK